MKPASWRSSSKQMWPGAPMSEIMGNPWRRRVPAAIFVVNLANYANLIEFNDISWMIHTHIYIYIYIYIYTHLCICIYIYVHILYTNYLLTMQPLFRFCPPFSSRASRSFGIPSTRWEAHWQCVGHGTSMPLSLGAATIQSVNDMIYSDSMGFIVI